MKNLVTNTGRAMVAMGITELGWNLIFRKNVDNILKDERVLAGAIVTVLGSGMTAAGSIMKDKEELTDMDMEIVEVGLETE